MHQAVGDDLSNRILTGTPEKAAACKIFNLQKLPVQNERNRLFLPNRIS